MLALIQVKNWTDLILAIAIGLGLTLEVGIITVLKLFWGYIGKYVRLRDDSTGA